LGGFGTNGSYDVEASDCVTPTHWTHTGHLDGERPH
jgi:hypothetical protein